MVNTRALAAIALIIPALLILPGCGKKAEAPKTEAQIQAEKDATAKAVRTNALTAAPMAGYDKAKSVQGTMDKQADEANKKIEADTK